MKISRRSFLKLGSAAAAAAIAAPVIEQMTAPLFIPAERLEMGVPRQIIRPEPAIWLHETHDMTINRHSYSVATVTAAPDLRGPVCVMKADGVYSAEYGYVDPKPAPHYEAHPYDLARTRYRVQDGDQFYDALPDEVDWARLDRERRHRATAERLEAFARSHPDPAGQVIATRDNHRGFADLVDRSYEEEMRRTGEAYRVPWERLTPAQRELRLADARLRTLPS